MMISSVNKFKKKLTITRSLPSKYATKISVRFSISERPSKTRPCGRTSRTRLLSLTAAMFCLMYVAGRAGGRLRLAWGQALVEEWLGADNSDHVTVLTQVAGLRYQGEFGGACFAVLTHYLHKFGLLFLFYLYFLFVYVFWLCMTAAI